MKKKTTKWLDRYPENLIDLNIQIQAYVVYDVVYVKFDLIEYKMFTFEKIIFKIKRKMTKNIINLEKFFKSVLKWKVKTVFINENNLPIESVKTKLNLSGRKFVTRILIINKLIVIDILKKETNV